MQRIYTAILCALAFTVIVSRPTYAQNNREPRARDLGVPFDGTPGPLNSITDVAGVEVGYKTLISGAVSYTHLDVYKRQGLVRSGDTHNIAYLPCSR